ncbi:hypothetical protein STEG23_036906 [Scotinomys teguina]
MLYLPCQCVLFIPSAPETVPNATVAAFLLLKAIGNHLSYPSIIMVKRLDIDYMLDPLFYTFIKIRKVSTTMEYYPAEKNNDIMKFAGKWMELENVILSEKAVSGTRNMVLATWFRRISQRNRCLKCASILGVDMDFGDGPGVCGSSVTGKKS